MAQDNLKRGIELAQAGQRDEARALLRPFVQDNPDVEAGWLWLAAVAENQAERIRALQQVIRINPGNDHARAALQQMGVTPMISSPRRATEIPVDDEPAPRLKMTTAESIAVGVAVGIALLVIIFIIGEVRRRDAAENATPFPTDTLVPTITPSPTITRTPSITPTFGPSPTPLDLEAIATWTQSPVPTIEPTRTLAPSITPRPTRTFPPSATPEPTREAPPATEEAEPATEEAETELATQEAPSATEELEAAAATEEPTARP